MEPTGGKSGPLSAQKRTFMHLSTAMLFSLVGFTDNPLQKMHEYHVGGGVRLGSVWVEIANREWVPTIIFFCIVSVR